MICSYVTGIFQQLKKLLELAGYVGMVPLSNCTGPNPLAEKYVQKLQQDVTVGPVRPADPQVTDPARAAAIAAAQGLCLLSNIDFSQTSTRRN